MKKLTESIYFKFGIICAVTLISVLIVLPRIPITIKSRFLNLDSYVGGYTFGLFGRNINLTEFKEGLDLKGGVRVVLKAKMDSIAEVDRAGALESATEVISKRVNLLGVSEPYIVPSRASGDYRIIVELPGITDVDSAVKLIGQTAQLKFKQLLADKPWTQDKFQEYYSDISAWEDSNITGADLKGAAVVFANDTSIQSRGAPQIQLNFSNEGRKKFSELAKKNINKPIGLFLDEDASPLSMPVVSPDLAKGLVNDPVITGNFDVNSAKALTVQIRAGALPVPVEVLEQKTIGATLGSDSVSKSFFAGVVGLVLVLCFMIFMYGRLGVLSGVALIIYSLTVLAIFKLVPVVLTLPGIAGFILSVGMATDANILIFERIKEEILWGRPKNLAIQLGFDRAWDSIKDSNVSSLITAGVLFYFGTGAVRGFAVTLAIGVLVSLFSAIFVVKTLIEVLGFGTESNAMPLLAKIKNKWSKKK